MNNLKSNTVKVSIAVKANKHEQIEDIAVVFMDGLTAARIYLIGPAYDEDDEYLGEKIISEECDQSFLDEVFTEVKVYRLETKDGMVEQIATILDDIAMTEDLPPADYIIYNDRLEKRFTLNKFKDDLYDEIENINSEMVPTFFDDIFPSLYVEDILQDHEIDHSYTKESALSAAIWTSVVFDILADAH